MSLQTTRKDWHEQANLSSLRSMAQYPHPRGGARNHSRRPLLQHRPRIVNLPTVGHFERLILHKNNGDSVGVIGLTKDGRVPLIEQYRIPVHRWTLEIPAGHAVDKGERPIDVAHRKLAEEVGYKAGVMTQFCRFINTPSYSTQHTALYFAYDLEPIDEREQYANEARAQVRFLTPQECYELVLNGTILDAKSIIAIQRLYMAPNHMIGVSPYDGAPARD